MATSLLKSNNLIIKVMNRKSAIRHRHHYHEEGIGTVTILLAVATIAIIFYSIYSAF